MQLFSHVTYYSTWLLSACCRLICCRLYDGLLMLICFAVIQYSVSIFFFLRMHWARLQRSLAALEAVSLCQPSWDNRSNPGPHTVILNICLHSSVVSALFQKQSEVTLARAVLQQHLEHRQFPLVSNGCFGNILGFSSLYRQILILCLMRWSFSKREESVESKSLGVQPLSPGRLTSLWTTSG